MTYFVGIETIIDELLKFFFGISTLTLYANIRVNNLLIETRKDIPRKCLKIVNFLYFCVFVVRFIVILVALLSHLSCTGRGTAVTKLWCETETELVLPRSG